MWLVVEQHDGASFGSTGTMKLYRAEDAATVITPTTDADLNVVKAKGTAVNYESRCYITGQYTDNVMVDEHFRLFRQGIAPPDTKPALASGGGAGPAGTHIGYISFYDELTDERSPLSGASASFANGGSNQIAWSNIPTTSLDTRVTHVEFWRSVDGGAIRFVTRRDLGISTLTESVATLALGEVAPDTFERFPPCRINALYHDRQFMAGDEANPGTLYYSALFKPERWEGGTFRTRNGEPITAILAVQDVLLILCPNSSYTLQGYTEADFTMSLSEPELGATTQHMCALVHGNAWIPNARSIFVFNGSWHNVMKHGMEEWRLWHDQNCDNLDLAFAVFDPIRNVYKLGSYIANDTIPSGDVYGAPASATYYWVADVLPATLELTAEFQQPNWSFDVRARQDTAAAVLSLPGGYCQNVYTGSCDGHLRQENVDDDTDDDGDAYGKRLNIRTGAMSMGDPGGDTEEGKQLLRAWTYLELESADALDEWSFLAMGGDEDAWRLQELLRTGGAGGGGTNVRFFYREDLGVPDATSEGTVGVTNYEWTLTKQGVFYHVPERVTGRCVTFLISVPTPLKTQFRGIGGTYGPGPVTRPPYDEAIE